MVTEIEVLRHIAQVVQDAFPGRKVKVWVEQSVLYPDKKSLIVCVDQCASLITVETFDSVSEQEIASYIIDNIHDLIVAEEVKEDE